MYKRIPQNCFLFEIFAETQNLGIHEMEEIDVIYKDLDLYFAAKNGNLDDFTAILDRVSASKDASFGEIMGRLSPAGNTFLHVAARNGHKDLVAYIASLKPSLVSSRNFNRETALHAVAKAGDASSAQESNRWGCIVEYLIEKDWDLPYCLNKNGESALYLAAKAGSESLVRLILRLSTYEGRVDRLFDRAKSPIHAAIKWHHIGVLEAMFDVKPRLIQLSDKEWRNPLHYAASLGHFEEARFLYNKCKNNASQKNSSGSFPIHLASIKGSVKVIDLLHRDFPDPEELLDIDGCNILHLAAKNGRLNVVRFVLDDPGLEDYINMQDNDGNTALHLATMHDHPSIVQDLAWDKRVDLKVSNDQGKTALDVAEDREKWLSYVAMIIVGKPGFLPRKFSLSLKRHSGKYFKENNNNLLVIAVLIATVTFVAGFTMPGESSKNPGIATLWREKAFYVFVLCDSIAMYTSVAASVGLICYPIPSLNISYYATVLLGVALTMMSVAFTAGILVVLPKLWWLASAILTMNAAFNVVLFLLFLPNYVSVTCSRYRVMQYLLCYINRWSIYLYEH